MAGVHRSLHYSSAHFFTKHKVASPFKCSAAIYGVTASGLGPEGAMTLICLVALTTDVLLTQAQTPAKLVLLGAVGR